MILNDASITKLCEEGMVSPYRADLVNPASLDLTLSPDIIEISAGGLVAAYDHPGKKVFERKVHIQLGQEYLLQPGMFVLASSLEYVKLPKDVAAQVSLKSTTARRGIGHVFAGWIDPGFEGNITFELFSHIPTVLTPNKAICQIVFYRMESPPVKPYQGKYQYQLGPTPAKQYILVGGDEITAGGKFTQPEWVPETEQLMTSKRDPAISEAMVKQSPPEIIESETASKLRKLRQLPQDWAEDGT